MIKAFSFLRRDPSSGILSFRLRIPEHLQSIFGKTEIKRSLRTADKRLAMPVAMRLYFELQDYFKRLENGEPMQKPKKRDAKQSNVIEKIVFDELELPNGSKAKGIIIDTGDDSKDVALAQQLLGGIVAPATATPGRDCSTAKLSVICKKYRAEKMHEGSWVQKTHDEHEALHELLSQVLGNPDISTITHKAAREFKDTLLKLPANSGKGRFAGKSIKQLLAMNVVDSECMHPRTTNEKLQRVSSLFLWAVRHGYCPLNPFEGLKMRINRRASEERSAFDDADLQTIFDPSRYSPEKLRKPFQYWCPLLALHTGARAQEIAQLRVEDVFEENGIPGIRISEEAGRLKTLAARRDTAAPKTFNAWISGVCRTDQDCGA